MRTDTHIPSGKVPAKSPNHLDRFHIMKRINEAVDEVRRGEVEDEPLLRKARYVLLKNRENLTKKQRQHREVLDQKGFRL